LRDDPQVKILTGQGFGLALAWLGFGLALAWLGFGLALAPFAPPPQNARCKMRFAT